MVFGMGNCTDSKLPKNEIIISIVGLDDAGKTTSVKVINGDKDIKELAPTVGFESYNINTYNTNTYNVTVNDLGGGARVRDIWKHYLAESYGFIFVIDSSNRNRIFECSKVFSSFVENDKVAAKPILILGNKQELPNSMDESEIVQYLNVEELVNKFQIPCRIETCTATSGIGSKLDESLKVGFEWLLKYIISKQSELKNRIDYDVELQKSRESKIKMEKFDKIKHKRGDDFSDDPDDYEKSSTSPWKALTDLKQKDSKMKQSTSDPKLSAYDKQLLEDMRGSTPSGRLTTIDEERSKLKNKLKENRFIKSNKLAPYDDRSDPEIRTKSGTSWAIAGNSYPDSKKPLTNFDRPNRRFEI